MPQPEAGKEYCYPLASIHAFLKTGKFLIFSEDKVEETLEKMKRVGEIFEPRRGFIQKI